MKHSDQISRRDFLQLGTATAALAGLSSLPLQAHSLPAGSGQFSDYKALVCVFLFGGADTFNLLVPTGTTEYATYLASRGDLAEPLNTLLPITPIGASASLGMHPAVPEMRNLFENERLAFISNVGPLVEPSPKAALFSGAVKPPTSLFSHNDQQAEWQRAQSGVPSTTGWAGRMLDQLGAVNGNTPLSPGISVDVQSQLLVGQQTSPYVIGNEGTNALIGIEDPNRRALIEKLLDKETHALGREIARTQREAIEIDALLSAQLSNAPNFDGVFPQSPLGDQLRMVARLISLRTQLNVSRQVFFVSMGGFDTHDNQATALGPLYGNLSASLAAFQTALGQINAAQHVTTFSHSEFGRTLSSNGQGSDHGWGGHAFVLGEPVSGRRIYGTLPDLTLEGPDDLADGRMIPTTAVDQFAATLSTWFGLDAQQRAAVFPNLANFAQPDLGFMI